MSKQIKKIFAVVLSMLMLLSNSAMVLAQDAGGDVPKEDEKKAAVIKEFGALKDSVSKRSYSESDNSRPKSKKDLKLPEKLAVTLENGDSVKVSVEWDCTKSDDSKSVKFKGEVGKYTFKPSWDKDAYTAKDKKDVPTITVEITAAKKEAKAEDKAADAVDEKTEDKASEQAEEDAEQKDASKTSRAGETITVEAKDLTDIKVGQEVNGSIVYKLSSGKFIDTIVATNFEVSDLPAGLTQAVTRTDDTTVTVSITGTPVAANGKQMSVRATMAADNIDGGVDPIPVTGADTLAVSAVAKGAGAAVSAAPVVSGTTGENTITVAAVTNKETNGQTVEYAISTASTPAPTAGWQDGTTFTGLTANTAYYVFARTKANDNYEAGEVQVSAAIKTAAPATAQAPVIGTQPTSAKYTQNKAAKALTVKASVADGGTLSYQWYTSESGNNSGGTAIQGQTSAAYTPSTATVGKAHYYVVVTNTKDGVTAETASSVATIEVSAPVQAEYPTITKDPKGATYTKGDSAKKLSVTAKVSDGGKLSYQWYKCSEDSNLDGTAIKGATKKEYTPSTVNVGTTYYYVMVTNTKDGTTAETYSDTAKIKVNKAKSAETPKISKQPASATYSRNANAYALKVEASVTDGGKLSYQWYRSSQNSTSGGVLLTGATSSSYTPSTATSGTYYYYVVVTNTKNEVTAKKTSSAAKIVVSQYTSTNTRYNSKSTTSTSAAKTGDTTQIAIYVVLGLAAVGAVIFLIKKKKA